MHSSFSPTLSAIAANPTTPVLSPPFGADPNRMHDSPTAARLVGLAPATLEVDRCRRRLKIAHYKAGRKILYRESDLMAFLASCRVEC